LSDKIVTELSVLLVLDYSCTRTFQALGRRITRDAGHYRTANTMETQRERQSVLTSLWKDDRRIPKATVWHIRLITCRTWLS